MDFKKNEVLTRPAERKQRGHGIFRYFKKDSTTPLQYLAGIIIGAALVLLGVEMIWLRFHQGPNSLWSTADAVVLIIMGVFVAHAGTIFWFERIMDCRHTSSERERGK